MRGTLPTKKTLVSPLWRALLCLALAVLFLHNPYLATPSLSGGLKVGHPASHRSTVGSSELQHFSPVGTQVIDAAKVALAKSVYDLLLNVSESAHIVNVDEDLPHQAIFYSSLWFRPPPVL
jgi:hypothetical protein